MRTSFSVPWGAVVVLCVGCGGGGGSGAPLAAAAGTSMGGSGGSGQGGSGAIAGGANNTAGMASTTPPPVVPCDKQFADIANPGQGSTTGQGMWVNVTPAALTGLGTMAGGTNIVADTVLVDHSRPSDVYVFVSARGVWKSTDYGLTFNKVNTGSNADKVETGYAWMAAIDRSACRDPSTSPTMYIPQGFGALSIWKSTDGGGNWTTVWDRNIFGADAVSSISSDVGSDIGSVAIVDPTGDKHLIVSLHGYTGTGDNNGIFESVDGGATWYVHKSTTFSFQPHNDVLFPVDSKTWVVTPGTISSDLTMHRTTDGGATWTATGMAPARAIGRELTYVGSTIYAGTDYNDAVYKSTDAGASWTKVEGSGAHVTWVAATGSNVYSSDGMDGTPPTIRHASLSADTVWTTDTTPPGMGSNGHDAGVTYDGSHYIIIAAQHSAGIWRFVEP
jgi:hypothetical protein